MITVSDVTDPNRCVHCDSPVSGHEWHPAVGQSDDDGRFTVYVFCDEGCLHDWKRTTDNDRDDR